VKKEEKCRVKVAKQPNQTVASDGGLKSLAASPHWRGPGTSIPNPQSIFFTTGRRCGQARRGGVAPSHHHKLHHPLLCDWVISISDDEVIFFDLYFPCRDQERLELFSLHPLLLLLFITNLKLNLG
jgi:hypothetical protein